MIKAWSDEAWEDFEYWSKRIDDCNRIVYTIENSTVKIVQRGSHYRDN